MSNSKDNPLRKQMIIDSFAGSMLLIAGIVGAISYKLNGDIELLIVSITALISSLVVVLAASVRKDLYDHMVVIENLLQRWNINAKVNRLNP